MDKTTLKDINGNDLSVGSAVCILNSGNFIYGHIIKINEDKVEVKPDIGYTMTKPHFRPKDTYVAYANQCGRVSNNSSSSGSDIANASQCGLVNDTDMHEMLSRKHDMSV